ncbi:MAG: 5'-methylthioadenosine/S-adenosylhomocysteine nucleosidase [Sphingobium sp.]
MRVAIITGVEQEADAFAPGVHQRVEQHGHLSVRFLEHGGHPVAITCCGVGKVNAAIAATMLATLHRAELLMIIGTAGKLSDIAGDCFVIDEAVQGDYGAQRSAGFTHYTAGSWPIGPASVEAFLAHPLPDIGLPQARIVTGDAFVECPDHSMRLRDGLGGDLVDMETGALAQVAQRLDIPWSGIKATTDDANGESVGDFQTNLLLAARRAAQAAEQALIDIA